MAKANEITYLEKISDGLDEKWPNNRTYNVVCHGHSVPAGYYATPYVNRMHAYPHLLHQLLCERFPYAVTNVIVTAIGGEASDAGAERFERDVLIHKPDLITIDYVLNDRMIGVERAEAAWSSMIEKALKKDIKVILLTASWDNSFFSKDENWEKLGIHCDLIRRLADTYEVGLVDVYEMYQEKIKEPGDLVNMLSHGNHPTSKGHDMIAKGIARYFVAR